MSCENAERILAKRNEALDTSSSAAPSAAASAAPALSASKFASAHGDDESPRREATVSNETPRSTRLLLFVQVRAKASRLFALINSTLFSRDFVF